MFKRFLIAVAACLPVASGVFAHDGVVHKNLDEALRHQEETSPNTAGFPEVKGGDFKLVDHNGNTRTSVSPEGQYQLIFFGYANCQAICSVALPRMAEAVYSLEKEGILVTPLLITVDPSRDTVDNMKDAVRTYHDRMVGLTGSEEALQAAYDVFQVEKSLVYEHPEYGPIYAHGSFIYLLGPDGDFKTLLPPILGPDRMAEVAKSYIQDEKS
ncbi:MAG: SCO family protein [Pseudomonadota bacterium]